MSADNNSAMEIEAALTHFQELGVGEVAIREMMEVLIPDYRVDLQRIFTIEQSEQEIMREVSNKTLEARMGMMMSLSVAMDRSPRRFSDPDVHYSDTLGDLMLAYAVETSDDESFTLEEYFLQVKNGGSLD